MGVYIKGMTYADALRLLAKDKKIIDTRNIIEVKEPHGKLVDLDKLIFDYADYYYLSIPVRDLDKIEVVIERSE